MIHLLFTVLSLILLSTLSAYGRIAVPKRRPEYKPPRVGVPARRPNYNKDHFYFSTKAGTQAPIILKEGGMSHLDGDSLIRFKILPVDGGKQSQFIEFESVPSHMDEKVVKGYMPVEFLNERLGDRPTIENLKKYQRAKTIYSEIQRRDRLKKEKTMDLQEALKEFHNQSCQGKNIQTEAALKASWSGYTKNYMLSERGKQLAKNAEVVDLAARTILFEAQSKGQVKGLHPKAMQCQWDILALSIRNRAFSKKYKIYGGKFLGDFNGVATNSQYNVWIRNRETRRPIAKNITKCFLADNYVNSRRKNRGTRKSYRDRFLEMSKMIPETLGISEDSGKISKNDISRRFQLAGENRKLKIEDFRHYFHPKGMNPCNVNRRNAGAIDRGILKVIANKGDKAGYAQFIPIVKGKVLGLKNVKVIRTSDRKAVFNSSDNIADQEWKIDIFVKKGRRWIQKTAGEVFGGDVGLVDNSYLNEKYKVHHRACFPQGIMPQCLDESINAKSFGKFGQEVPTTWYRRDLLVKAKEALDKRGFVNAKQSFVLPKRYKRANTAGTPVKIRCISEGTKDKSRPGGDQYPVFGGLCDKNIGLVAGVDISLPKLNKRSLKGVSTQGPSAEK